LAPRAASNIPEHQVVLGLLQSCRYGQYQVPDPEGNYVDVSASNNESTGHHRS
jgi:hypothetical protein